MINYNDLLKDYKEGSFIPYTKLLSTEEWNSKREKILERDKNICQNCKRPAPEKFDFNKLESILGNLTKVNLRAVGTDRFSYSKLGIMDKINAFYFY